MLWVASVAALGLAAASTAAVAAGPAGREHGWAAADPGLAALLEGGLAAGGGPVGRVDGRELGFEQFEQQYLGKSRPAVLTGLAEGWSAPAAWASKERFAAEHGQAERQARWAGAGNQFGILARRTSVGSYLEEMGGQAAAGREGLLFDSAVGHGEHWQLPALFERAGLADTVVSVGAVGQGLPLHNHASAWQTVVVGRKAYFLLPPLHSASWLRREEWFVDLLATLFLRPSSELLQQHLTELARRVPEAAALLQTVVLGPGETLFIPCNWYHATLNLADTVAVGGQASASERNKGRCVSDIYGAASSAFADSVAASRAGGAGAAVAYERGQWACEVNRFNFNCAPHMAALLLGGGGDKAAAIELYSDAVGRYEWLAETGLLNRTQLSAVLAAYSERLMSEPGLKVPPLPRPASPATSQPTSLHRCRGTGRRWSWRVRWSARRLRSTLLETTSRPALPTPCSPSPRPPPPTINRLLSPPHPSSRSCWPTT